jgi:ribonuclease P protein component
VQHSHAFPRSARLTQARQFTEVFGRSERQAGARLLLRVRPRLEGGARLGMAIARKRARSAVLRNRIKRLLRERFRHMQHQWPAIDLIVLLRGPMTLADCEGLGDEFQQLVERAIKRIARSTATDEATH